jgi:hypothetical protein
MIITHPHNPALTCDLSKRGRRPLWYHEFYGNNEKGIVKMAKEIKEVVPTNNIKIWRWAGIQDADEESFNKVRTSSPVPRIFVNAKSVSEAIKILNTTMKNAVSPVEFSTCWKQVAEPSDFMLSKENQVWQEVNGEWVQRKVLDK